MDIKIELSQIMTLVKCFTSLAFDKDAVINLNTENGTLVIRAGKDPCLVFDTNIQVDNIIDVCVSVDDFLSNLKYIAGFKKDFATLKIQSDCLQLTYKNDAVNTNVFVNFVNTKFPQMKHLRPTSELEFDLDLVSDIFSKVLVGTGGAVFSGGFDGVVIFNHMDKVYVGGTNVLKCVVCEVPFKYTSEPIYVSSNAVSALSNISKHLQLPCIFKHNKTKFVADFGGVYLQGSLLRTGPNIASLLGIKGSPVTVDKAIFANALKGAMKAASTDLYKAITIDVTGNVMVLKTRNFSVKLNVKSEADSIIGRFNAYILNSILTFIQDDSLTFELDNGLPLIVRGDNLTGYVAGLK